MAKVSSNKQVSGLFGPTLKKHYYSPVAYHNKSAIAKSTKNKWCVKKDKQYEIFKLADESNWICQERQALFSILDDGKLIMGTDDEVLGFFRIPQNASDPWHGFPVKSDDKAPSSNLLDIWVNKRVISNITRLRIERGAL